jgi:hypothetical protein
MSERNPFAQGPYKARTAGDNEDDKAVKASADPTMSADENETTKTIRRRKATI